MNVQDEIVNLAIKGEALKKLGRSGWPLAGVDCVRQESVGEHAFGTIFLSLMISQVLLNQGEILDLGKVLSMATIHDLPESLTSDIPQTAGDLGGDSFRTGKAIAEMKAIHQLSIESSIFGDWFIELWKDIEGKNTLEARIVRGADIIDMLVHAISLEMSGISPAILDQFFVNSYDIVKDLGLVIVSDTFWELYNRHIDLATKSDIQLNKISRN